MLARLGNRQQGPMRLPLEVILARSLLLSRVVFHILGPKRGVQKTSNGSDGARCVVHVHDRLRICGGDPYGSMNSACGRTADQERDFEPLPFHLRGHMDHLVQRGGNQPAEPDGIRTDFARGFQDSIAGHHHAKVDHLVVVASQHHADNVLADIMHIAFHGRRHQSPLGPQTARSLPLGLHEREQASYGLFHHARALYHLRQEHLPGTEQVADHVHACHERAFNDREGISEFLPSLFHIGFDVIRNPLYQGMREAFLDAPLPPLPSLAAPVSFCPKRSANRISRSVASGRRFKSTSSTSSSSSLSMSS